MRLIERLMMRYLRRRGWVVFWLDPECRHCYATNFGKGNPMDCWLELYNQGER